MIFLCKNKYKILATIITNIFKMVYRFDFIKSRSYREMVSKTYNAVCDLELWNWLRNYELLSENIINTMDQRNNKIAVEVLELLRVINGELTENNNVDYSDSIIYVLREMQYIARHGLQKYKDVVVLRGM